MKKKQRTNPTKSLKRVRPITSTKELAHNIKLIKRGNRELRIALLCFYVTKDWRRLGYEDFKHFVTQELPEFQYDTVLAWMICERIVWEIVGEFAIGRFSMNAIRVFRTLDFAQQKELWESLKKSSIEAGHDEIDPKWLTATLVLQHRDILFGILAETPTNNGSSDSSIIKADFPKQTTEPSKTNKVLKPKTKLEPAAIVVNQANSSVVSRSVQCNRLLEILESYDGSESLAKTILDFSIDSFGPKTLIKMMQTIDRKIRQPLKSRNDKRRTG